MSPLEILKASLNLFLPRTLSRISVLSLGAFLLMWPSLLIVVLEAILLLGCH